jgi:galactokinase
MEAGLSTWNLKGMTDCYQDTLTKAGMGAGSAQAKACLFAQCLEYMAAAGETESTEPLYQAFVPGRIEFLGKHTDYAGGRSLVTAVDLGFNLAVRRRTDRLVRIHNVFQQETLEFSLDAIPAAKPNTWTVYPLAVARRMVNNFPGALQGAEIAFLSDLPPASGMSSSSAFIIAIFMAFAAVNNLSSTSNTRPISRTCRHWPDTWRQMRTDKASAR